MKSWERLVQVLNMIDSSVQNTAVLIQIKAQKMAMFLAQG